MIKRFKFLVIIFILSIYSKINCSDFPRNLNHAIHSSSIDFSKLTPEQEACYLPQIDKTDCGWIPIRYACFNGNVSAFKWLLSNGAVPTQECFKSAIVSDNPQAEIVSGLLIRGCYTKLGKTKTLLITPLQEKLVWFSKLATASSLAEVQKISVMIKRYEDAVGLRTAWNAAVVSAGASYPGAGSGVVGVTEIEE